MTNKTLKVKIQEDVKSIDNLITHKKWFNGIKKFFTVKPLPPSK